jgi:hypothetical protein
MESSMWDEDCPRCGTNFEYDWQHGKCPQCGLLYFIEQVGETWTDECPVPVFESDEVAIRLYQVGSFDNHPMKNKEPS